MKIIVAALYQFVHLDNHQALQAPLIEKCREFGVRGILLLAEEGINGTIASTREGIDKILAFLRSDPRFADLPHKESYSDAWPFGRMKVRLKKEIVTMGVEGVDPNRKVGVYVPPSEWNALISDPDVVVIDTRNDYELSIGTFTGSIDPNIGSFKAFPNFLEKTLDPAKNKKVAMFCTGGIRCEKATSYLLDQGFEEVYHLRGGILKYLEEIPPEDSLWEGECFVFDERISVGHALVPGDIKLCRGCREPLLADDKDSPLFEEGVACPRCNESITEAQKRSRRDRQHFYEEKWALEALEEAAATA